MPYQREVAEDDLTERILGCAVEVHKALGPNRSERDYQLALSDELDNADLSHEIEYGFEFEHNGKSYPGRADVVVEEAVVLELKVVARTTNSHFRQALDNVRQLGVSRGLLVNFGQETIDIRRIANGWELQDEE